MSIDTKIPGSPGSVEGAASWLRDLGHEIEGGRSAVRKAQATASHSWNGQAGDAFSTKMGSAEGKISGLNTSTADFARACDDYAAALRTVQSRMEQIRNEAASHGLTVAGDVIEDPGPGPADPGSPPHAVGGPVPPHVMAAAMDKYNSQLAAFNRHQKLVKAYNTALTEVDHARKAYVSACEKIKNDAETMVATITLNATDIAGQATAGGMGYVSKQTLLRSAKEFDREADVARTRFEATDYEGLGKYAHKAFYADQEDIAYKTKMAEDYRTAAGKAEGNFARSAKFLSRGLAVAGLGWDIFHDHIPVPEAVTADGSGYGAGAVAGTLGTIATDAAIGAALGTEVPVVGNVVGGVIGAGVGIFVSSGIKSWWEHGSVGGAVSDGANAVKDTVGAIGDGVGHAASSVGHFVGDLF